MTLFEYIDGLQSKRPRPYMPRIPAGAVNLQRYEEKADYNLGKGMGKYKKKDKNFFLRRDAIHQAYMHGKISNQEHTKLLDALKDEVYGDKYNSFYGEYLDD